MSVGSALLPPESLFRYPTEGEITSSISFSHKTSQILYTSLTGKVVALKCKFSPSTDIHYEQEWMYCTNGPIFGSPCCSHEVCLVSTVEGMVFCIDLQGQNKLTSIFYELENS